MSKRMLAGVLCAGAVAALGLAGCSAAAGVPSTYVFDTAKKSESAEMAKYDWYSVDQDAGTITVTLPADDGCEYGCNIFNEDVMKVASEKTENGAYTATFEAASPGSTSLNFYGYTADTGRTDHTALLEVDIADGGAITVYYTGNDFEYDPERFDCIPVMGVGDSSDDDEASTEDRKMW